MKQIYDKKTDSSYDWVFATNVKDMEIDNIIKTYKKRWGIETSFRIQDEAMIKCKSKEMKIRYFLFMCQEAPVNTPMVLDHASKPPVM